MHEDSDKVVSRDPPNICLTARDILEEADHSRAEKRHAWGQ